MKYLFFMLATGFFISCTNENNNVRWVSTTNENRFQEVDFTDASETAEPEEQIELFPDKKQQVVDGFGASFNELGWDALNMLDSVMRDSVMSEFYKPEKGLNFTLCRVPVGANDYARNWYSLNETPGDYEMEHFNIERDRTTLIPYIRYAMQYNQRLKVWGSPWCPPAWMKTNNHYACRPDTVNDLSEEGRGQEGTTQFIMDDKTLSAYALYFKKFVEAYRNEGVNLYAVHVQNEPNSCQNFPSCIWSASDLNTFIGEYLGPELDEMYPEVELWYGTIERPYIENIDTVLQDEESIQFVDGLGFQWAGKQAIPKANEKYPDMKLMQTESECGDGSNNWDAAMYTWGLIKHYFEHGVNSYLYWNPILDETGKSQWGWKQNSLISVDSKTGKATFNPEYYIFKHLTHFVKPGAHKIETSGYEDALAFENPDGSVVVLLSNQSDEEKAISLKIGEKEIVPVLDPHSFHTIEI